MKKMLLMAMALMLLIMPMACADETAPQTREEIILIEGMEETITTTYYHSDRGYSIWLDTGILEVQPEVEGIGFDILRLPGADGLAGYEVDILYAPFGLGRSFEDAAKDLRQSLLERYGNAEQFETDEIFTDLHAYGFFTEEENHYIVSYAVDQGEGAFYITICYPADAAEWFGVRVARMLGSFAVAQ
ncbi:MAG: hypothetical protein FWF69_01960 [Firmicutes bacterium]|nr:hypothetical protein [Bacillota bacterium]